MTDATELEWLKYFYGAADFGPAHDDVENYIQEDFEKKSGKRVPAEYRQRGDE